MAIRMKPKLKMKGLIGEKNKATNFIHDATERQRKSELQMPRQIEKRDFDGMR